MAGKIPIIPLPGAKGTTGSYGDPGYTGDWGQKIGAAAGAGGLGGAFAATGGWVPGMTKPALTALFSAKTGATAGAAAGPGGAIVGTLIGAALGAAADWLFGKATKKDPKPGMPPPPKPQFAPSAPYQSTASKLTDPGAGPGMQMGPNVRFSAAQNLQRKFNQGTA